MTRRELAQREKTLEMATAFLAEVRRDLERATAAGCDLPPRLRTVHVRAGHATPEYRTLALPNAPGTAGASPATLSAMIAQFAELHPPACMILVFDCVSQVGPGVESPVLIVEARDAGGTRLFYMQPFEVAGGKIVWGNPLAGGWQDPGEQQMILDPAFVEVAAQAASKKTSKQVPLATPPVV